MAGRDTRILKRISGILAVGAMPGALLGFIGDFFVAQGGWAIVLSIGLLSLIAAVYLLVMLALFPSKARRSWWYRVTTSDGDMEWFWEGSPWLAHGLHVVVMFSIASMVMASQSYHNRQDGGLMAQLFDVVDGLQKIRSENERIARDVRETKQLIQDNRLDEIVRLGFNPPDRDNFIKALQARHYRAVELFLQTNVGLDDGQVVTAYVVNDARIFELLAQHPEHSTGRDCVRLFGILTPKDVESMPDAAIPMFKSLCNRKVMHVFAREKLTQAGTTFAENEHRYQRELAARRDIKTCMTEELRSGGQPLLDEAARFKFWEHQETPRETMLAQLASVVALGFGDIQGPVREYCTLQASPQRHFDDREVRMWRTILTWTSAT